MTYSNPLQSAFPGPDPSQSDIEAFCTAAKNGQTTTVSEFLDRFGAAIIDRRDHTDDNALTWAAYKGDSNMVALLLDRGADIDAKGFHGKTALCCAAQEGRIEVVTLLLNRGADTRIRDKSGCAALDLARKLNHDATATLIEQHRLTAERLQKLRQGRPPKLKSK